MPCGIGGCGKSAAQCKTVCGPKGCKKSCSTGKANNSPAAKPQAKPQGPAQGGGQVDPMQLIIGLLQAVLQGGGQQQGAPSQ